MVVLIGSALLWCFATRHSTQAMAVVLVKCCNAVAEHHSIARRVGLSASMAALCLLQRTRAICYETCLALNADRPTESINTTMSEYQSPAHIRRNHRCPAKKNPPADKRTVGLITMLYLALVARLFCTNVNVNTTVFGTTFTRIIAGDRVVLTITADINDARINAFADNVIGNGLGAAF